MAAICPDYGRSSGFWMVFEIRNIYKLPYFRSSENRTCLVFGYPLYNHMLYIGFKAWQVGQGWDSAFLVFCGQFSRREEKTVIVELGEFQPSTFSPQQKVKGKVYEFWSKINKFFNRPWWPSGLRRQYANSSSRTLLRPRFKSCLGQKFIWYLVDSL